MLHMVQAIQGTRQPAVNRRGLADAGRAEKPPRRAPQPRSTLRIAAITSSGSSVTCSNSGSWIAIFSSTATVCRIQSTRPAQYFVPTSTIGKEGDLLRLDERERLE